MMAAIRAGWEGGDRGEGSCCVGPPHALWGPAIRAGWEGGDRGEGSCCVGPPHALWGPLGQAGKGETEGKIVAV